MFTYKKSTDLDIGDVICNENGEILGEVTGLRKHNGAILVGVSGPFGVYCTYTMDPEGSIGVCDSSNADTEVAPCAEDNGLSLKAVRESNENKRIITVKSVPYSRFMTKEDKQLVDEFNSTGELMQLEVYDHYANATLEDILDQGMYDYKCSDDILMERLYELSDYASPVGWDEEDVVSDSGAPTVEKVVKEAWNVGEPSNFAPNGRSYHSKPEDWKEKHEWVSAKLTAAGYKCKGRSPWNSTWTNGNSIEDISVDYWDDFDVIKEIIEMSLPIGVQTESVVKESSDLVKRVAVSFDIQTSSELSESDIEKSIKEALEQKGILVDSYMEIHTID